MTDEEVTVPAVDGPDVAAELADAEVAIEDASIAEVAELADPDPSAEPADVEAGRRRRGRATSTSTWLPPRPTMPRRTTSPRS